VVHEGARVLGNIEAAALVVAGRVEAGLLEADKVELRASANVVAAIRARVLVIADNCDRGVLAFRDGEPQPLGDPVLIHYEDLHARPEPHYVEA